ncbi:hypothetical protein SFRURICE_016863, partial [Spodoptera frugiperda]
MCNVTPFISEAVVSMLLLLSLVILCLTRESNPKHLVWQSHLRLLDQRSRQLGTISFLLVRGHISVALACPTYQLLAVVITHGLTGPNLLCHCELLRESTHCECLRNYLDMVVFFKRCPTLGFSSVSWTRNNNLWITQRVAPCGNRTRFTLRSSRLFSHRADRAVKISKPRLVTTNLDCYRLFRSTTIITKYFY